MSQKAWYKWFLSCANTSGLRMETSQIVTPILKVTIQQNTELYPQRAGGHATLYKGGSSQSMDLMGLSIWTFHCFSRGRPVPPHHSHRLVFSSTTESCSWGSRAKTWTSWRTRTPTWCEDLGWMEGWMDGWIEIQNEEEEETWTASCSSRFILPPRATENSREKTNTRRGWRAGAPLSWTCLFFFF